MTDDASKKKTVSRKADSALPVNEMASSVQIASRLKALYSAVEEEPIPDMFLDLLEKLELAEKLDTSKS